MRPPQSTRAASRHDVGRRLHDPVDEAVLLRLRGGVPAVVQGVLEDPLHGLTGVVGDESEHGVAHVTEVVRLRFDLDRGSADSR